MTEILRICVGDMDGTTYTDAKLKRVLVMASWKVLIGLRFAQPFAASIAAQTISPDPTLDPTKDDSFVNLATLQAACIMDQSSALTAASRALAVRDGGSSVDLRGIFGAKLKLIELGWCAVFDDARTEYQSGSVRVAGAAVMTPFRLYHRDGPQAWAQDWYRNREM